MRNPGCSVAESRERRGASLARGAGDGDRRREWDGSCRMRLSRLLRLSLWPDRKRSSTLTLRRGDRGLDEGAAR